MTKQEYIDYHADACERMKAITKAKNDDYTGGSVDPFANFNMVEHFGVATTAAGMFIRMTDKFSRIASFLKQGVLSVKDESIEDTLLDLANYCIIMAAHIKSLKEK